MAIPTMRAAGAKTAGTGAQTPGGPAGLATGDLEIIVATADTGITLSITADGGGAWTQVTNTPVTAAGARPLYAWYRIRAVGDTDPTITPSSLWVNCCRLAVQTGTFDTSDPLDIETAGSETTSDTSFSFVTGVNSSVNDSLIVCIATTARDSNTGGVGTMANANLSAVTLVADYCTAAGNGGGFGITRGGLATAGAVGTWSSTYAVASAKTYITFAVKPPASGNTYTKAGFGKENG